jgi:Arylsulfotransferase (ASST)
MGRGQTGGSVNARARRRVLVCVAALVAVVGVACNPVKPPPEQQRGFPPFGGLVETDPGLFPHFSTGVTDYVSRCDANTAVLFSVNAPADTTVSVDGQTPQSGQFNTATVRDFNQSFTIVVQGPSGPPTTHYVRCLPPGFPDWSAQRNGQTQAGFYLTSPTGTPVIFDNDGVPIWWWTGPNPGTSFSTFFDNGHVAWGIAGGAPGQGGLPANDHFEEHALDGSLVQSFNTVNNPGEASEGHDAARLPNGHYLLATSTDRPHENLAVDWADPNAPTDATIIDHKIQEIDPANPSVPVWSWDTRDHISPSETDPQWRQTVLAIGANTGQYDVYHWNSIEATPDGVILSYRHLDAVYRVEKSSSNVVWKLGGSDRLDGTALNFQGDPIGNFGGQHDARLLPDGSVTLHDNGTGRSRAPRAVRYTIDTTTPPLLKAGTATLDETITDSLAPTSFCCGSARKLPGGDWVMGWGGTASIPGQVADQVIEEKNGSTLVFALQIHGLSTPLYRGVPILPTQLSREQLRAGMDAEVSGQSAGAQSVKPQTANGKIGPEFMTP